MVSIIMFLLDISHKWTSCHTFCSMVSRKHREELEIERVEEKARLQAEAQRLVEEKRRREVEEQRKAEEERALAMKEAALLLKQVSSSNTIHKPYRDRCLQV